MATPVFDAAKHGIGLGTSAGTLKGFQLVKGSYRRRIQERDVRRVQVGKERWLQDSKVSYWVQDDFSGGSYQDVWEDPAMFTRCVSMLPSKRNPKSLRTCQSLEQVNATVALGSYVDAFVAWGALWLLGTNGTLYRLTPSAGSVTVAMYNAVRASVTARCIAPNTKIGTVSIGYSDGRVVEIYRAALTVFREFRWDVNALTGVPTRLLDVRAMRLYGGQMVVAMGNRLCSYDASVDTTLGAGVHTGTVPWTVVGDAAEEFVTEMVVHASQLFILSQSGTTNCSVDVTTLVSGVLAWARVPYMFTGQSMESYSGRLYVGGCGYDPEDGTAYYGQLFEMDGNKFREMKVFYDDGGNLGVNGTWIRQIPSLCVFEGQLLFPNAAANGVESYDFINDAFYTGYTCNATSDRGVTGVFAVGSELYVVGSSATGGLFRAPRSFAQNNTPMVETSEFAVEPSLLKHWTTLQVHSRFGAVTASASVDGGYSFTALTRTSANQSGYNWSSVFDLSPLANAGSIRVCVYPATTNGGGAGAGTYYYREVAAVIVGFILEPPTLRMYDFGLVLAENLEGLDGVKDTASDPETDLALLWSWYDNATVLTLQDRDGTQKLVLLTLIQETEPAVMGKLAGHATVDREVFVTVGLAEVQYA